LEWPFKKDGEEQSRPVSSLQFLATQPISDQRQGCRQIQHRLGQGNLQEQAYLRNAQWQSNMRIQVGHFTWCGQGTRGRHISVHYSSLMKCNQRILAVDFFLSETILCVLYYIYRCPALKYKKIMNCLKYIVV
jgi:hypothetical protein